MCEAIQEMIADSEARGEIRGEKSGEKRGEIKGAVEMCKKFNLSLQDTIQHMMEQFDFTAQRAEEEVKKYWK